MSKRKMPKWMRAHLNKCRTAFGLEPGTELHVTRLDCVDESEPETVGSTDTASRYLRAHIQLRRDLARSDQGYTILTYEALHAVFGRQRQAVNQIMDLVPPDLRDHAERLWQDGNEPDITALARALTPLLRAMKRESLS